MESAPTPEASIGEAEQLVSETELRARRTVIIGLVAFGVLVIGLVVLLVILSINAYNAAMHGAGPDPGAVVVSLLRDAAIIVVAFETLVIGVLLVLLTIQVQALVRMLQDEIQPMLASLNETVSTVRGTTQFVSHHVVSPTIKAASFFSGVRRVLQETVDLIRR
jgi:hypothetical protein